MPWPAVSASGPPACRARGAAVHLPNGEGRIDRDPGGQLVRLRPRAQARRRPPQRCCPHPGERLALWHQHVHQAQLVPARLGSAPAAGAQGGGGRRTPVRPARPREQPGATELGWGAPTGIGSPVSSSSIATACGSLSGSLRRGRRRSGAPQAAAPLAGTGLQPAQRRGGWAGQGGAARATPSHRRHERPLHLGHAAGGSVAAPPRGHRAAHPNLAPCDATTRSHASAISQPPASAAPSTAAISGLVRGYRTMPANPPLAVSIGCPALIALRSAPAQNTFAGQ